MTRLLAAAALVLTAAFAVPATAEPLGECSDTVDVACGEPCHPIEGCTFKLCVVVVGQCLAQTRI